MFNLLIKLSISFYGDLKSLPLAATSATIGRYAAGGVTNAPLHGSFYGRNKIKCIKVMCTCNCIFEKFTVNISTGSVKIR